ncbi:helix-turn-helix domain-containing protein [Paenisporosarcina sp. OV554]|uniref:helix-turn-helix domain-containing protein n=1 Tax=Paenisporosarcina sp. OV554 TaxID=2135694 RepID=UPI000D3D34FC|nr:helix-turn-helix transcriptional regulator [Paenisporosarcina sp. OV554]PUB15940.1 tetratricopeptide repeat protein [Paenisporosarcina sp. OV554]
MNNFGHVIKLERIRRNMKQITLAQGVCTPSYLSKIENNSIIPSQEVIDLLLNRLELSITQNKNLDDDSYLAHIREIYFNAIMNKDRELVAQQLKKINNEHYLFSDSSNYYTYQLMVLRLTLIAQKTRDDTSELILALSELSSNFNDHQTFLFHTCVGNFYYFKHDYALALKAFEQAYNAHQNASALDWETADFYYMLSLIYLNQQRLVICIEFIQKALSYFKDNFYYHRAIECYLVLSVAQKRSFKLDEAQETLQLAKRITIQLNLEKHFFMIFHNLGSILAQRGDWEKAIEHYIESMTLSDEAEVKLMSIISIVQEFSKQGNANKVIEWAQKGIQISLDEENPDLQLYHHHLNIYISKYSDYLNFEQIILKAIQFFKNTNDYIYIYKYYTFLAEYFYEKNKYKNAAKYYSAANEYLFLINNYSSWEDL